MSIGIYVFQVFGDSTGDPSTPTPTPTDVPGQPTATPIPTPTPTDVPAQPTPTPTLPIVQEPIGSIDTPGSARGVAVAGNYAYVADDSNGFRS